MSEIKNGGHIVLTVKDLRKSLAWYKPLMAKLGFAIVPATANDPEHAYFGAADFAMYVALFQGHPEFNDDTFNRYRIGLHHLALSTKNKAVVDDIYTFLQERGDSCDEPPRHYPDYDDDLYYALFFHDPDGLRLELFYEE